MKRLFFQVYGLIMLSLLASLLILNYFNDIYYSNEVEGEYLKKASMLTQAIQRDIAHGSSESASIAWWRQQLHENDEIELDIKAREPETSKVYIKKISITEAEDQLEIIAPFDATRALHFKVHDRADPAAIWVYYCGYAFIYLMMAMLLYLLTRYLYLHIEEIRQQAKRVADGDYHTTLPTPRITAFTALRDDLNRMTRALVEQTQENHVLTAAIHHELRTPITRLRLALDMAIYTPRPQEIPELLQDMDSALTALSELMEDLLTLSRMRLTQQTPQRETLALDQLLLKCAASFHDPRIQLQLLPCTLHANRPLLERALHNILDNAHKYANQHILVSLALNENQIELTISDDGTGIPEAARDRVRQAFFRIEKHRNRQTGGLGLGLAIADLALKESDATWSISSSAWGGTAILIRWKLAPENAA